MLGRALIGVNAVGLLFGAVMMDMGETHMKNPRWPPHAKFHNAQTITLSVMLGLTTLYYANRTAATPQLKREFLGVSALAGSLYWVAGLASILFPGTMGLDPEFGGPAFPQGPVFSFFATCGLLGSWLEGRSVG